MINIGLSDHFDLKELCRSNHAIRAGIQNVPNEDQIVILKYHCREILEKIRTFISVRRGKDTPLIHESGFRNDLVNQLAGGSPTSAHRVPVDEKRAASDIDLDGVYTSPENSFTNKDLFFAVIDSGVKFDQLIWEYGDNKNPAWVHIGSDMDNPRRMIMRKRSKKDAEELGLKEYDMLDANELNQLRNGTA